MSKTNTQNQKLLSPDLDNCDNVSNRMHLMSSARKNWSLTDRKTDQEVLQEMGIGLLQQDEDDTFKDEVPPSPLKPNLKRKRDIENMNPNIILSANSPHSPYSPRSPKMVRCNTSPGPSKIRSPRSSEKTKPLQSLENQLETTLQDEYLMDEETPLGQSVSAHYLPTRLQASSGRRLGLTPLGEEEEAIINKIHKSEPVGNDSFSELSDEMMLSIFKWLPKRTLAHCMLVCKRWHRVACDETLWQRLDLGNKVLAKDALGRIIDRKPIVVRLATSEIGEWNPKTEPVQSRIQYLDLSMCTVDTSTLQQLMLRCTALKKLSLEGLQLNDDICQILGECGNLETLNLTMAQGITETGLKYMLEGCNSLQALNISWCNLSEAALGVLVNHLPPRLQRLNIGGARIMIDDMVAQLVERCPRLLELDLSDCSRLCAASIDSILTLSRCEHLALSRCYLLPPHALTKLSSMPSLQYLEVWGMLQTASLSVLKSSLPAIQVNQFMFSAIARPTVGTRRTSIWGLRTRD